MNPLTEPRDNLAYQVRPVNPDAHLFEVELQISGPVEGPLRFAIPAWIPGSYMIRDFARNLVQLWASDGEHRSLPLTKLDKQTWLLDSPRWPLDGVVLRYRVYAWELSVRAAHLDRTHAYFNGASLLLQVIGREHCPCTLAVFPPQGDGHEDWRIATSMAVVEIDARGFGVYRADDYLDLIDHPVEMGRFTLVNFNVAGVPHAMAISGRHRADPDRLARDLQRICAQHSALFGDLPIDRYLFLVTALGEGYGGLEHRYSSSLLCCRDDLPGVGEGAPGDGYRRFLGLCSHEYFHLWHVKRIRPLAFVTGGLAAEVHTRLLWAFEGITSYYDDLALVRSGCIDVRAYLQDLAQIVTRVLRTPGRLVQTLAESSFDAWTKFYKQDENAPNAIVSYYAKGALTALALDLTMRRDTGGDRTLDHLMRALWARHGRTGIGVEERGIEALASEISGLCLDDFFAQALDSTQDLDLDGLLATVGVALRLRPANGPKDLGGCVERFDPPRLDPTLAVRLMPGAEAQVQNVLTGGAGERAGLAPGDLIVAVDGLRANAENLERLVAQGTVANGGSVRLHLFRRDELLELTAQPEVGVADTCELMLQDGVSDAVLGARSAWLASLD